MTFGFWVQFKREIASFFVSPIAYITFIFAAAWNGLAFSLCVYFKNLGADPSATITDFFFDRLSIMIWFLVIPLAPVLTMRLLSEEYRNGTIEGLLTAPITEWDVVLSKFFGAFVFYLFLWAPTFIYILAFQGVIENQVPLVWEQVGISYLMLFLISGFYLSIGIFTSSLTRNQIVAVFSSFVIIGVCFFGGLFRLAVSEPELVEIFNYFFTIEHLRTSTLGILDSRAVVLYLSGTALFLFLTQQVLIHRRINS